MVEATTLFEKALAGNHDLVLTNFVLAEAYGLILFRLGAAAARRWLNESGFSVVRVSRADEARAREILFECQDKDFSYVDASSFAVMERLGLNTAFTFDQHSANTVGTFGATASRCTRQGPPMTALPLNRIPGNEVDLKGRAASAAFRL